MADDADLASEIQEQDIARIIEKTRAKVSAGDNKERDCAECNNPIPTARIKLTNSRLCVECQRIIENETKQYRH